MQKARNKIYAAVVAVVLLVAAALSLLIPWQKKSASADTVIAGSGRFSPTVTIEEWCNTSGPIDYDALTIGINSNTTATLPLYPSYEKQTLLLSSKYPVEVFVGYNNKETGAFGVDNYLKITGNRVLGEPWEDLSGFRNGKFEHPNMGLAADGIHETALAQPRVGAIVNLTPTYDANNEPYVSSMSISLGNDYFNGSIAQVFVKAWFNFYNGSAVVPVQCEYTCIVDTTQSQTPVISGYIVVPKTDLSNEELYKSGYNAGFSEGLAQINESEAYQRGYDKGHHDGKMEAEAAAEPTPIKPASVEEAYKKGYSEGYFVGLEVNNKDSKWYDGYKKGYNDAVNGFTKAEDPEAPEEPAKAWYQTAWEYFVNWIKVYWWVVVIAVAALSIGIALAVRRRRW